MSYELSESEQYLLHTPFGELTPQQRAEAFSLSDRIAEYNRKQPYRSSGNITVWDKGICFKDDAVKSPVDGKAYSNRQSWDDMLKRNGCVQVGNDFNNSAQKKREIKGDFDCHKELAKVTHQVAEKYGY